MAELSGNQKRIYNPIAVNSVNPAAIQHNQYVQLTKKAQRSPR